MASKTSNTGCCSSCGQTNCNKLSCGCGDHSLSTPCNYTGRDCTEGTHEKCEEVYCEYCVSNCDNKLEIEISATSSFVIEKGERLSATLQKLVQYIVNPTCVTGFNAILNIQAGTTTSTSVQITWDALHLSSSASALQVRVKTVAAAGWTNITPSLLTTATSYVVTSLSANTAYMFSIKGVGTTCTSAFIYHNTTP
jgi:hypothetical protein